MMMRVDDDDDERMMMMMIAMIMVIMMILMDGRGDARWPRSPRSRASPWSRRSRAPVLSWGVVMMMMMMMLISMMLIIMMTVVSSAPRSRMGCGYDDADNDDANNDDVNQSRFWIMDTFSALHPTVLGSVCTNRDDDRD